MPRLELIEKVALGHFFEFLQGSACSHSATLAP